MFKVLSSWFGLLLCTLGYFYTTSRPAFAQVTSDGTVNTQVTENGNTAEITGGETRGDNLFHSFQDFSVNTGNEAFFNNADSISNIFSRITGGNVSDIDGAIRANGSANLFLINPAGILFGENASLNIGGSFYGSSASSILFEDGEFSAADLDNPPLLTVNAPIGLGFRDNPGDIVNRASTGDGLEVGVGKNIALIGGNVSIEKDGIVFAPEGRIELGGLAESGIISLTEDNKLSFPNAIARGNVSLTDSALVSVGGFVGDMVQGQAGNIELNTGSLAVNKSSLFAGGVTQDRGGNITINATEDVSFANGSNVLVTGAEGGSIQLNTKSLSITSDSRFFNGIREDSGFAEAQSGDININATDNVVIDGQDSVLTTISNSVGDNAIGNAGEISISARNISLNNSGRISSSVTGQGNGSDITLNAKENISINGSNDVLNSDVGNVVSGEGNSGTTRITAQNLTLSNGGNISNLVTGVGDSGDININVNNSLTIDGKAVLADGTISSGIISSSFAFNPKGTSGDISISTTKLSLRNGGQINSSTAGTGNAGNIDINSTESVTLDGESYISSALAPGAVGNGGLLNIATPSLTISGSGILTSTVGEGDGGSISIDATDVVLTKGGLIDASNGGIGNAGSVFVKADTLSLNNGKISARNLPVESLPADKTPKVGGNINLEIEKSLFLDNDSNITAIAGGNADGGNVDINANFIVAFPDGNNNITAGAVQGKGGNIRIATDGIFGIEERPLNKFTNDINASSEVRGFDGTVNINTSDINPLQGATELPSNVVEAKQTADQTCSANQDGKATNGLAIAGRGGISPSPDAPLNSENINHENPAQASIPQPLETSQGKIQPARGIKVTKSGKISLTPYRTNNAGERIPEIKPNCN